MARRAARKGRSETKVAIVTGASAGVGRAVVEIYARRSWRIGLIAREPARLRQVADELTAAGASAALALPADVAEAEQVEHAATRAEEELGPPDVWIIPLQAPYCAAKFAVRGFLHALRAELALEAAPIRLSMVQLPAVDTPQFDWARNKLPYKPRPAGTVYDPMAVAREIVRAADRGIPEVFVGGQTAQLGLGSLGMPRLLDHLLADTTARGQQSEQPEPGGRPDNLFEPVPGNPGARGRFGAEARAQALTIQGRSLRFGAVAAGAAASVPSSGG